MTELVPSTLYGAIAMAALVAALFFFRYWRQTRDSFFLLFAMAFAIDAMGRVLLALQVEADESEPLYYIPRLITFLLIILAIVIKNRPGQKG